VDGAQYARSVREDSAELASYALSDRASIQSASPPTRPRPAQTQLELYFTPASDSESASNRDVEGLRHEIIQEVSEPASPVSGPSSKSPGNSALADMIKRSPLGQSPPDEDRDDKNSHKGNEADVDAQQERRTITTNGVKIHDTERTPLIWKDSVQDLEDQDIPKKLSWTKLRKITMWPREKGFDLTRTVINPRRWDSRAIWDNAVLAPISVLPAVTLGLLLNILDALSYGMCLTQL
jgi:SulP family sulfate permease